MTYLCTSPEDYYVIYIYIGIDLIIFNLKRATPYRTYMYKHREACGQTF